MTGGESPALAAAHLSLRFVDRRARTSTQALDDVSLTLPHRSLCAIVGPDGGGKTTLMRLAAGLLVADAGRLDVLGIDVAREPQAVQDRIGYMPQRFGLYDDLSVQENLDLYADLHGVPRAERRERYRRLMEMTDLGGFTARAAGKLSGGMKQKLGLACTLVRAPEVLLLDEPTAGVDPLSRRELWRIIEELVERDRLSVVISTTYLDEAERCSQVFLLRGGRLLAGGTPADLRRGAEGHVYLASIESTAPSLRGAAIRRRAAELFDDRAHVVDAVPDAGAVRFIAREGAPPAEGGTDAQPVPARLEDGFMLLLDAAEAVQDAIGTHDVPPPGARDRGGPVISVSHLTRKFGDFTAVADTSFTVSRGEVFGLLGPNGAGKTTTFRMLCGLLPPTSGTLRVAGVDMRTARASARRRIGYVAQKFALYGNLSVAENLRFFAGAYGLVGGEADARVRLALDDFDLANVAATTAGNLPGGFRQRLAMAAALLHEPEILFLDEPTSGADPLARRAFWRRITTLSAGGTTVVVTTHFMEEAEYCDRVVIQDAGRVLAIGTPDEIRGEASRGEAREEPISMDEAFVRVVRRAREREAAAIAA